VFLAVFFRKFAKKSKNVSIRGVSIRGVSIRGVSIRGVSIRGVSITAKIGLSFPIVYPLCGKV